MAAAGCGGAVSTKRERAKTEPASPNDPATTLERFAEAARGRNTDALWQLLSLRTRAKLGPTLAAFRRRAAAIEGRAGVFRLADGYSPLLSESLGGGAAVAAVARSGHPRLSGHDAYATALRFERGAWRVVLGAPLRLRGLLPEPGKTTANPLPQLALEIRSVTPIAQGGLWLDGVAFSAQSGGVNDRWITIWGRAGVTLAPGEHFVVGFARAGHDSAAVAWSFVVRRSAVLKAAGPATGSDA
jgi:hypothetical protein